MTVKLFGSLFLLCRILVFKFGIWVFFLFYLLNVLIVGYKSKKLCIALLKYRNLYRFSLDPLAQSTGQQNVCIREGGSTRVKKNVVIGCVGSVQTSMYYTFNFYLTMQPYPHLLYAIRIHRTFLCMSCKVSTGD